MKKIRLILILAFGALFVQSCQDEPQNFEFQKLVGNWKDEGTNKQFFEEWKVSNSGIDGLGFVLSKGDTIMIENMKMLKELDNLVYEVKVNNQNHGQSILFSAVECTTDHVVFENRNHDFPQTIAYSLVSDEELRVILSGEENEQPREIEFNFSKIN